METPNRTYDELEIGESAEIERGCTADDFLVFANASGNLNPLHLPRPGREAVAPAQWVASLVGAVIGNRLPGAGTLYRATRFRFLGRAHAGDLLVARARVEEKRPDGTVLISASVAIKGGETILEGEAEVEAPTERMTLGDVALPGLLIERHVHFDALLARAEPLDPIPCAVAAPEDAASLAGALLAARHTILAPILVGDPDRIRAVAEAEGLDLGETEIVAARDDHAAAHAAVDLVVEGRAAALMKGRLHTDALLRAVLRKERGLRAGRRLTHVFVMDVPGLDHPLLVTDAAINIQPDLETKVDIVQNAIDVAISIGMETPRVGVLSAIETVNPKLPSSTDAALLSKMAERGQITGGLVDGPLAMDNAVDLAAARTKGIRSEVAGRAQILVAPDLDAGNMIAKQLTYIAHAEGAGVVLGARAPIILTSRADGEKARLASAAVAALHAARLARGRG